MGEIFPDLELTLPGIGRLSSFFSYMAILSVIFFDLLLGGALGTVFEVPISLAVDDEGGGTSSFNPFWVVGLAMGGGSRGLDGGGWGLAAGIIVWGGLEEGGGGA